MSFVHAVAALLTRSPGCQVELGSKAGALRQMLLELLEDSDRIRRMTAMGRLCRSHRASGVLECDPAFDEEEAEEEEEEVETLLEYYLQRCDSCHGQAEKLLDSAKEMEDSIAVNLRCATPLPPHGVTRTHVCRIVAVRLAPCSMSKPSSRTLPRLLLCASALERAHRCLRPCPRSGFPVGLSSDHARRGLAWAAARGG